MTLSLEREHVTEHFVGRCDGPGVTLESSLERDHLDKLLGEVHVGCLQAAGDDSSAASGAGGAEDGFPGIGGGGEQARARAVQSVIARELREGELSKSSLFGPEHGDYRGVSHKIMSVYYRPHKKGYSSNRPCLPNWRYR